MNDIENFKIFSTNGFSIGITQHPVFRGIIVQIVDFCLAMTDPWILNFKYWTSQMSRVLIGYVEKLNLAISKIVFLFFSLHYINNNKLIYDS